MKTFKQLLFYAFICFSIAFITSKIADAFFWSSEPKQSPQEIYVGMQESSNASALALKEALIVEFQFAADMAAESAKAYYEEHFEESPELKGVWNDRKADLERVKDLSGRELVEVLQWGLYSKSKPQISPGKH